MTNNQPSPCQFSDCQRAKFTIPSLKAQMLFWSLMAAGLALDLWTKAAVFDWLKHKPGNSISIIDGLLRLVLAQNDGAAFGLFSGKPHILAAFSALALIVIIAIFLFSGTHHTTVHIALALFTAGVCGNLYDRIFNEGFVRDFIDVVYWPGKHWPAFNVADSLLCIGVGVLILSTFVTGRQYQKHGRQHKSGRSMPPQEQ